jgi:hypothetical protein
VRHPALPLRGLLVALAAVALSAGVVLAARPVSAPAAHADAGLERASQAAGKTVPVTVQTPTAPDADADADQDEDTTTDAPTTDPARKLNHGWYVSQAARADTPAGFANHGAYVSSIAKGDLGKPAAATAAKTGSAHAAAAKAAAAVRKAQHQPAGH